MSVRVLAVVALVVLAAAAPAADARVRVKAFASCAQLDGYARTQAKRPGVVPSPPVATAPPAGAETAPAAAPVSATAGPPDFSQTNVQEEGIDEPDLVKTDGTYLYVLADQALKVIDARAKTPSVVGSLDLGNAGLTGGQLLLRGKRLLVMSQSFPSIGVAEGGGPAMGAPAIATIGPSGSTLSEVDVRDPAAPKLVRTLTFEGTVLDARLHGRTARVVVQSYPSYELPGPAAWRPTAVFANRRTGVVARRPIVRCNAVRRAPVFSGLGMLTVLTMNLDRGITPVDADGVMSDGGTVYASASRLYVATHRWFEPTIGASSFAPTRGTTIAAFDARDPDRTTYLAAGDVRGYVLNQFALSEYRGHLRVATTDTPLEFGGDNESFVTVLDERGNRLEQVGRVGGLGRGERIEAVRFLGDAGFVVTFRRVDPLYTIDLSEPANPRVLGELKVEGYSAYLHPIGADRLLGVGQDATAQGRTLGTQLSLFDISDLRNPRRLDRVTLAQGSSSNVEWDHHAFLYWPQRDLAVVPVNSFGENEFSGAVGFRVGRSVSELGRVDHPFVTRSVVVGSRLFTLSTQGVMASSLDGLGRIAFVAFG